MRSVRLLDRLCAIYPERDREQLLALVLCGDVSVGGECIRDPQRRISADADVSVSARRYVGRGALKLEHAIDRWSLPVSEQVFLDAGASSGGFTDCLLQHGASLVHAVDVGWNQLDYRLRRDPRVRVHERTNIMDVKRLDPQPAAAAVDLSFRSLRGAASHAFDLVGRTWAVLLVKPQFEWREAPESFDGTVPDAFLGEILSRTLGALADEDLPLADLCESPVRGRKGNREFLLLVRTGGETPAADLLAGRVLRE